MKLWRLTTIKTVLVTIIIVFFGVVLASLLHTSASAAPMLGDMSADCPFMSHEGVICSMDILNHLTLLKTMFIAVLPSLALFLLSVVTFVLILSVAPHLLQKQNTASVPLRLFWRQQTHTYIHRSLQELFSNGILHPKLF